MEAWRGEAEARSKKRRVGSMYDCRCLSRDRYKNGILMKEYKEGGREKGEGRRIVELMLRVCTLLLD
jgi:hypothetical protein